jgi:hypothetical protein
VVGFKGAAGVRSGWRFAGFMALVIAFVLLLQGLAAAPIAALLHVGENTLNAKSFLLDEGLVFIAVLAATTRPTTDSLSTIPAATSV